MDDRIIRDVWASNLEQELKIISDLIEDYPYIAMDTEFPGVIVKPVGSFKSTQELEYQTTRCNVDLLKIIQIGITLGDKEGFYPTPCCTWQFNFKFDEKRDPHFHRSIVLLQQSGIDFKRFNNDGIDVYEFARLLIPSGLVMNPGITWVSFHSITDFGYLIKVLTAKPLPETCAAFFKVLELYFPNFYDIKYYTYPRTEIADGLQKIANQLGVSRVGREHQAGSDAFVTLKVFFELKRQLVITDAELNNAKNKLFGASAIV
ncbi:CAF1 family ribonuclease containing protein [Trichomonas vaginalis G3]|uniref:poly(A)-specific ribonuclease n=1 Tax=Trichomonas vaginalis (strain ATCC PRA-98 / G3) TaxID=412133 RepID=A2FSY9_TRIV3|nr:exonucleolytic nuclear-transcribed mRNA catabolic process involved in deadenylation-dependent decay [Trichomonas vaginalis G3]EAX91985.1 CAF1 family ribonuclease containing protein [Trichomonas vaginalis G3]KAI5531155.1 exonucleolytic nuclear-transcribed mRNA catabolic process involved in deadenylation-dependent decay [Trichomonas vaginalis G3]|eukprot:XP_001304915.1 CAF1 family ribonuclease containing protein [Trichomonas vaginalis G3]